VLIHVADGFAARHFDNLKLAESEEMRTDRAYLDGRAQALAEHGLRVTVHLALGNPPAEILKAADANGCDLIAITTHGRSGPSRWVYGSVTAKVLRSSPIPLLVVRHAVSAASAPPEALKHSAP